MIMNFRVVIMIRKMIAGYASKISVEEYKALRTEVIRVINLEDKKRCYK